jgi:hypothetical protein
LDVARERKDSTMPGAATDMGLLPGKAVAWDRGGSSPFSAALRSVVGAQSHIPVPGLCLRRG